MPVEVRRLASSCPATNRGSARAFAVGPTRFVAGFQHWIKATELAFGVIASDFEVPGANVVHSV
jgi:hypothetical protein